MRARLLIVVGLLASGLVFAAPTARTHAGGNRVDVLVDVDKDEPHYRCKFVWSVKFSDGTESTDSCDTDISNGVQNHSACWREYSKPVTSAKLESSSCKAK